MFPSLRRAATVIALGLLTALPAAAFDIKAMTEEEKAAFGAAVKEWLLANPDILIDMSNELEKQQFAQQVDADRALLANNHDAIFNDGHSWVGGNLEGDVTLVEFVDYRCTYCRKANAEVEELVKSDGNIRFVLKEFPILGDASTLSSKFAVAVHQLGTPEQYKRAHDELIALRGEPEPKTLSALAKKLGLDAKGVLARMESPEVAEVIELNHALARELRIEGTPTFLIGDTFVRGYVPLDALRQIVNDARS